MRIEKLNKIAIDILGSNIINKKSILGASLISYLNLFVSTIIGVIMLPYIVNYLGVLEYGIYVLLISSIGYFSLLNLGFTDAIIKYVSEYHTLDQADLIRKITSTASYLFLFVGLIVFFLSIISSGYLPYYFNLKQNYYSTFKFGFILLAFNFIISLQGSILASVISGYQQIQIVKIFNLVQILLYNGLIYLFVKLDFGVLGIICAALVSGFLHYIFCLFFVFKKGINYSIYFSDFDKSLLSSIFPYSFKIFILGLTSQLLYKTDAIVIGIILGASALTGYDLMFKISIIIATLSTVFSDVLFPAYSRLSATKNYNDIEKLLNFNLLISFSIVSFFVCFLHVWGDSIFDIWVGNKVEVSHNVFMVMISINFLHAVGPCFTALKAIGEVRIMMISSIINAIFNLFLSIYLAHKVGIIGVLYSTILSHLFTDTFTSFYLIKRFFGISLTKLFLEVIIPPIFLSFLIYIFNKWIFGLFFINERTLLVIICSLLMSAFSYIILTISYLYTRKSTFLSQL